MTSSSDPGRSGNGGVMAGSAEQRGGGLGARVLTSDGFILGC